MSLDASFSDARSQWSYTASTWRDTKGQQFQAQCWSDIEQQVNDLQKALEDIQNLINQSQRDVRGCE